VPTAPSLRVLTVNTGSSSLKAALYAFDPERVVATADASGLGTPHARVRTTGGEAVTDDPLHPPDQTAALGALTAFLARGPAPHAVGHRVVHGGREYEPQIVTPGLLSALERLVPMAPNHLPQAIRAIAVLSETYPSTPQIACFDTAFHRHLPAYARRYALPRSIVDTGVERYGFHGLSYESVLDSLMGIAPAEARGRLVIGHLGNGASLAALKDGVSIETTMGYSPAGGLVMGSRPGDLDPGVLVHLLDLGMTRDDILDLFTQRSGLIGVSELTGDMRELLAREAHDPRAALAVELFCYQARKFIGALTAALGGLDTLVFTGGIGEHSPVVRARITRDLAFLGVGLDERANARGEAIISPPRARVTVRVVHTDEDRMIARHTRDVFERTPR
jgi:acetate kinase